MNHHLPSDRIHKRAASTGKRPELPRLLLAAIVALTLCAVPTKPVAAHAALDESDPAANAVLAAAPARITLRFTEPLERSYSRAELYDQTGAVIAEVPDRAGDDDFTIVLEPTSGLPNGTYSVFWRSLSTADGHTASGYFAFTIGSEADVRAVAPPPAAAASTGGPPDWLRTVSRWLSLVGLAASIAVWPVWLFVLRPAISPAWQLGPTLTRRVHAVAVGAVALALVGSVVALLVQASGIAAGEGLLAGVGTTINETRYGTLWLIRVGLLLVYAGALLAAAWWWPRRRWPIALAGLVLAAALPLPFSLISHAAAQPTGWATAVAADALHLLAASLWAGGLLVLVAALAPTIADLTAAGRRAVLGRAVPRFSALALVAWGVLGLTGFYSAWLNVGSLDALRTTPYGQSLIWKLALLLPLLALGAVNLVLVSRRLARGADLRAMIWSRRFVGVIAAEAALVVLVLLVTGRLTAQPPARDVLTQEAGRLAIALDADGQRGTLYVTPGAVGPNHYRLELGGGHDHSAAAGAPPVEALLRVELPSAETGQKQIDLAPVSATAYEGHGSELAIEGDWQIEAIVRQAGQEDWNATTQRTFGATTETEAPGEPPRFDASGIAGLLLLTFGIAGLVLAWQAGRSPLRRESAGLGTVALLAGAVLLGQGRIGGESVGGVAVAAPDAAAVARGEAVFAANCLSCHGTRGAGDGPAAAGLVPPPADLTSAHARSHADDAYAYWITNGIPGGAMPAFGDQLSEAEIRDVVSYVRDLQGDAAAALDVPGADDCRIEPRTLDGMRGLVGQQGTAATDAAPPAPPAVDTPGAPAADAETVAGLTATLNELVACTNAGDLLRRLALYSDDNLRGSFPQGVTEPFVAMAQVPPAPVPVGEAVALLGVDEATVLDDGRVRAVAAIDNPLRHSHGPVDGTPTTNAQIERATLILVRAGDRWLIDAVQRSG